MGEGRELEGGRRGGVRVRRWGEVEGDGRM